MKAIFLLFSIVLGGLCFSQTIELLGDRFYEGEAGTWDGAEAVLVYEDSDGGLYIKVNEASPGRTPELIKYNYESDSWDDLWNGEFPLGLESTTDAVGYDDGSHIAVMRSFDDNGYVYRANPDLTYEYIGSNPIINGNCPLYTSIAKTSNDDLYIAAGLIDKIFMKWDGNSWVNLSPYESNGDVTKLTLSVDENDDVYISYQVGDGQTTIGRTLVKKYNASTDSWEAIYTSTHNYEDYSPYLLIVSSDEMYLCTGNSVTDNYYMRVQKYNGETWETIGNHLSNEGETDGPASIIKTSLNDLYLATVIENGFYRYNQADNVWQTVTYVNDDFDAPLSGYSPILYEKADGKIINSFADRDIPNGQFGLTTVMYTPENLEITDISIQKEFTIYPNPFSKSITWTSKNSEAAQEIKVFDLTGKLIYKNHTKDHHLNLEFLTKGIYVLKIDSLSFKIIKK